MDYTPDRWVVLRLTDDKTSIDKIFAGWSGGYLTEDSWKLNSGCVEVVRTEDGWDVHGGSGSVYHLREGSEGMTGYMGSILAYWKNSSKLNIEIIDIDDIVLLDPEPSATL